MPYPALRPLNHVERVAIQQAFGIGLAASADVEREFGRLKNEWALSPLRVRGLDRVRLHADLTILAKLGCTLARAVPLPA